MSGFLDALLAPLRGAFSKRSGSVLGVDIGSSSIKVVQLRRERGQAVLETYGAIALGPYGGLEVGRATNLPPDKLTEALRDVIREANVTTKDCAFSIPYAASLVSLIKMPNVGEKQLATMVPIEARKYIPVPIGEVALDWFAIPKEDSSPQEKISVLLVAIHKDTIGKYQGLVGATGLNASFFEIEVFSAVRAALDHGLAPVAVMDMGAGATKLYVVERGIVKESHLINRGSQDATLAVSRALNIPVAKAEELKREKGLLSSDDQTLRSALELTLAQILTEANRTLLNYQARSGTSVSRLVITGGGAALKGYADFAKGKLQVDVELADPFAKTKAPAFLAEVLRNAGPEFSVATGLALRKLQELS